MRKWFIVKDQSVKGKLLGCPLVDNEAAALIRVFEVCFTLCAIENMTINLAGIYLWLCRWRCVFSVILGSQRALEQRALWGQRLKSHNFSLTSTNSVSLCRGNYPLIHFSASKKITFFILGFWLSQAHTHTHTHTLFIIRLGSWDCQCEWISTLVINANNSVHFHVGSVSVGIDLLLS